MFPPEQIPAGSDVLGKTSGLVLAVLLVLVVCPLPGRNAPRYAYSVITLLARGCWSVSGGE